MIGSKWQQQARLIVVSSLFVGWIHPACLRPLSPAGGRKEIIGLSDNHPTSHTQSGVRDAPLFEFSLYCPAGFSAFNSIFCPASCAPSSSFRPSPPLTYSDPTNPCEEPRMMPGVNVCGDSGSKSKPTHIPQRKEWRHKDFHSFSWNHKKTLNISSLTRTTRSGQKRDVDNGGVNGATKKAAGVCAPGVHRHVCADLRRPLRRLLRPSPEVQAFRAPLVSFQLFKPHIWFRRRSPHKWYLWATQPNHRGWKSSVRPSVSVRDGKPFPKIWRVSRSSRASAAGRRPPISPLPVPWNVSTLTHFMSGVVPYSFPFWHWDTQCKQPSSFALISSF